MDIIYILDLIGTLVFAISGVLAAVEKKLDLVGALILGFVTAVGGGTLRDLLIGQSPVGWMLDPNYLFVVLAALPIIYFGKAFLSKLRKGFFFFDSLGIGLFTVLGIEKTLAVGLSPLMALLMGVVSAVFGGIIRDVLSNEVPLIFRKEIYATACFAGGLVFLTFYYCLPDFQLNMVPAILVVLLIRYLAVRNKWGLGFNPLN